MTQEQRAPESTRTTTPRLSNLKLAWILSFAILLVIVVLLVLLASIYTNLSEKGWTTYTSRNSGLVSNDMSALAIDEEGRVWVGTVFRGLSVLAPDGSWTTYTSEGSGLVSGRIEALAFDEESRVWVGTSGGLSVLASDGSWMTYTSEDSGLVDNPVSALAIDAGDRVWVGTSGGLSMLAPDGSWTTYTSEDSGLASGRVQALAFDEEGRVWVGTSLGGLSVLAPDGSWTTYTSEDSGFASDFITALAIDEEGRVWVGTLNRASGSELSVLAPDGSWTTYNSSNSGLGGGQFIGALAIDEEGRFWVGIVWGGLSVLAPDGSWMTYTSEDSGLVSNSITALSIDGAGRVWVGTGNNIGLSRFDERTVTSRSILRTVADVVSILRLVRNLTAATFVILSIGWFIEWRRRPTEAPSQIAWGFWLWWLFASTVGLGVGGVLPITYSMLSSLGGHEAGTVEVAVGAALVGASLGIAQWFVLRRRQVPRVINNFMAQTGDPTGTGTGGPGYRFEGDIGLRLRADKVPNTVSNFVFLARDGFYDGVIFHRAGWWVLASTVGMAVGWVMGWGMGWFDTYRTVEVAVGGALVGASLGIAQWFVLRWWQVPRARWWVLASTVGIAVGAVSLFLGPFSDLLIYLIVPMFLYGVITGGVMAWLLGQPVTEEPSLSQDAT